MKVEMVPISRVVPAPWNPNVMDGAMRQRLKASIERFGMVVPLVVRRLADGRFETIGGAQRLQVLREMGVTEVPCVFVDLDDPQARLLAQALNRVAGEDDPSLRMELLNQVLEHISPEEAAAILPETAATLAALRATSTQDMASYLRDWERAQAAKLRSLTVRLTAEQLAVVEEVLGRFESGSSNPPTGNPNKRGVALVRLCEAYRALAGGQP